MHRTLSSWRQWDLGAAKPLQAQPEVVRELLGGRTNRTFLVTAANCHAVVRVNSPLSASLGIDRHREGQILSQLQATGIVPQTYFSAAEVLVSQYIEGRPMRCGSSESGHIMQLLSDALDRIQAIDVDGMVCRRYLEYCRQYMSQLPEDILLVSSIEAMEAAATAIDEAKWRPVICHHDLVPENIIINDLGVFILDWEYAAIGHPGLDRLRLCGLIDDAHRDKAATVEPLMQLQQTMDQLWLAVQKSPYEKI